MCSIRAQESFVHGLAFGRYHIEQSTLLAYLWAFRAQIHLRSMHSHTAFTIFQFKATTVRRCPSPLIMIFGEIQFSTYFRCWLMVERLRQMERRQAAQSHCMRKQLHWHRVVQIYAGRKSMAPVWTLQPPERAHESYIARYRYNWMVMDHWHTYLAASSPVKIPIIFCLRNQDIHFVISANELCAAETITPTNDWWSRSWRDKMNGNKIAERAYKWRT